MYCSKILLTAKVAGSFLGQGTYRKSTNESMKCNNKPVCKKKKKALTSVAQLTGTSSLVQSCHPP